MHGMRMSENPRGLGPRELVVSGKVSVELYDSARNLIDGINYRTMNDVVEDALFNLVKERARE